MSMLKGFCLFVFHNTQEYSNDYIEPLTWRRVCLNGLHEYVLNILELIRSCYEKCVFIVLRRVRLYNLATSEVLNVLNALNLVPIVVGFQRRRA